MNKTVTINISGLVFHINEDAYGALNDYLTAIRRYVAGGEDAAEIMADIESRIAELLQQRLGTSRQVVDLADVDELKIVLGNPEAFATEGPSAQATSQAAFTGEKVRKRFFRDPDDKVIGGVCSGLGAYFGVDAVWVRLAMFGLVFFFGLSIWVYIILWMITPLARTSADKFAMHGEASNIDNIVRAFRDEAEDVKHRFARTGSGASHAMNGAFTIFGKMVGLFMLVFGGMLMIGFIISLISFSVLSTNEWFSTWRAALVDSRSSYGLAILSYVLVIGIPIAMLIYGGAKLMLRLRHDNRWLNFSLGIAWLAGVCIGIYVTVLTLRQFSDSAKLRRSAKFATADSIIIRMNPAGNVLREWNGSVSDETEDLSREDDYIFHDVAGKKSLLGFVRLSVFESDDDSVSVVVSRSANGPSSRYANEMARYISYDYDVNNNVLSFDQLFNAGVAQFRAQEVEVRVNIPIGKIVYFDHNTMYSIRDGNNTMNLWPGKLAGRKWKMTSDGLSCIDCTGLDADDDHHHHRVRSHHDM